jgi:hypothetical protein
MSMVESSMCDSRFALAEVLNLRYSIISLNILHENNSHNLFPLFRLLSCELTLPSLSCNESPTMPQDAGDCRGT